MGIFDDIGDGFKKAGETVFVKPVNNFQKGVNSAKNWTVGAAEDTFHEIKGDIGAGFGFADKQISKVTDTVGGIFNSDNLMWIVLGLGILFLLSNQNK